MSFLTDIFTATRELMLIQYKIEQLTLRVDGLSSGQQYLRERMVRLETIVGDLPRRANIEAKALPTA